VVDWSFTGWSGDLTGATNPQNLTMDGDKTITATFTEDTEPPPEPGPGAWLYKAGALVPADLSRLGDLP
jgi:uncharacterized repeat protein (TIGR02543 family)